MCIPFSESAHYSTDIKVVDATTKHGPDGVLITRASSTLRRADFHAAELPFTVKLAAFHRKMRNCPFFATFISNSRFFGLLNFTIYKTSEGVSVSWQFNIRGWIL